MLSSSSGSCCLVQCRPWVPPHGRPQSFHSSFSNSPCPCCPPGPRLPPALPAISLFYESNPPAILSTSAPLPLPQVPAFCASKFKVTNGEFHAFVRSGGYNDRRWWTKEGWGWRTFRNVKWPTFWVPGARWLRGRVGEFGVCACIVHVCVL